MDGRDAASTSGAKFHAPPVIEVAVAVEFVPLPGLGSVGLVELWRTWREDFPHVQEQVAAPPSPDPEAFLDSTGLQIHQGVQPLRLWMFRSDRQRLLQIQNDRLVLNWRRDDGERYPSYEVLRQDFVERWRSLNAYARQAALGLVRPSVAEVTFVNRIEGVGADLSGVLTAVAPCNDVASAQTDDVKLVATSIGQASSVSSEHGSGRLTVAANYSPEDAALILTITTRLRLPDPLDDETMLSTLDFAHDVGVRAFVDATRPTMHEAWKRYV